MLKQDMECWSVSEGLSWTGERYLPSIGGIIQLEHIHRYLMAKGLARGKDVLDIASGEGYGSAMLAEVARSVIGVDNSEQAVVHAAITYTGNNLEFRYGACEAIPLDDASIDLVVSFETIEHHDQHQAMMREIRRVLRPGGMLMISSPDKYEYSVVTGYRNPYHVKELYRQEFEALLSQHFRSVAYLGQRVLFGSAIFHQQGDGPIVSFRREEDRIISTSGIPRPVYLIGIASDGEPPALPQGFFVEAFDQAEGGVDRELQASTSELSRIAAERDALRIQCAESRRALADVHRSMVWRLTRPVRAMGNWVNAPRREFGRFVRRVYHALPLSMALKLRLKALVFRRFGRWLGRFQSYRSWLDFERRRGAEGSGAESAQHPLGLD